MARRDGEPSRLNLLTIKINSTDLDFSTIKSVHYQSKNWRKWVLKNKLGISHFDEKENLKNILFFFVTEKI